MSATVIETNPSQPVVSTNNPIVEAYFQRIGYQGNSQPTLETLKAIQYLHPNAIPFENLNPLLGIPVKLEIEALKQKLVDDKRGGYCFEHNLLLGYVLRTLGFKVKNLAARVLWNQPAGAIVARGHMLLLVEVQDKKYIVDAGFGGATLTAPLLLIPELVQITPHESFRLLEQEENYLLQINIRNEWKAVYRFSLEEQFLPDYEVSSYYLSTNPASHFTTGLIVAKPAPGVRYSLRNNELAVHHLDGTTERQIIDNVPELRSLLEETFGIQLPEHPTLELKLQQLVSQ